MRDPNELLNVTEKSAEEIASETSPLLPRNIGCFDSIFKFFANITPRGYSEEIAKQIAEEDVQPVILVGNLPEELWVKIVGNLGLKDVAH